MTSLLYLHGFLSSPLSEKAQLTGAWMAANGHADAFLCPQIEMDPDRAAAQLLNLVDRIGSDVCVVGSSLGGFLANWLAEERGLRAVMVNPAVCPYRLLSSYVGEQRNYQTGEVHVIDAGFADALRALERRPTAPERYWLLTQTGDEVLDYRDGVSWFSGCRQSVIEGGSHAFEDYARWLPAIWAFAQEH
ncbi:YqiA/YcfP family alpha/beta fold hydrolase [Chitinibacteraceae bacterium HSL-7]